MRALHFLILQAGLLTNGTTLASKTWSISNYRAKGSGCQQEQVKVVKRDENRLDISINPFKVQGRPIRKNCVVILDIDHQSGWSFAIEKFKTAYNVKTGEDTKNKLTTYSYFQGNKEQTRFVRNWKGTKNTVEEIDENSKKLIDTVVGDGLISFHKKHQGTLAIFPISGIKPI